MARCHERKKKMAKKAGWLHRSKNLKDTKPPNSNAAAKDDGEKNITGEQTNRVEPEADKSERTNSHRAINEKCGNRMAQQDKKRCIGITKAQEFNA